MKRLLIVAVLAGLTLAGTAAQANPFRIRYKTQYSGGAYLGYPAKSTYSSSYYPDTLQGQGGYQSGYQGNYQNSCQGCNQGSYQSGYQGGASAGQPTVTIKTRVQYGNQTIRQYYSGPPLASSPVVGQPVPAAQPADGVAVPKPADPKSKVSPVLPKGSAPKAAQRTGEALPILVADEQEVAN